MQYITKETHSSYNVASFGDAVETHTRGNGGGTEPDLKWELTRHLPDLFYNMTCQYA
ncbi:hypothetical protein IF2G_01909 [Cordyceps javanica]|nr:hypothetical protein IF2G_01909 [Cordyceps javanica]